VRGVSDSRGGHRPSPRTSGAGRHRIAAISGPPGLGTAEARLAGYLEVLREGAYRSLVASGDFTRRSGAEAMRRLLSDDPALDAVFAANDLMALGALHALHEAGRRVPDDVAIVGFDDIEAAAYALPSLTTVRVSVAEQAMAAVRLLLTHLAGGPAAPVIVPAELIVRRSS
jgi:beta-glucosidase